MPRSQEDNSGTLLSGSYHLHQYRSTKCYGRCHGPPLEENPERPQGGRTREVESRRREASEQACRTREQTQRLRQAH